MGGSTCAITTLPFELRSISDALKELISKIEMEEPEEEELTKEERLAY